ncbi:MAG: bifunctional phosphopantothenoylcysteine decarboxylase/phosphopantothenate--cysteine ligase CoaBC [Candidatus Aminicenantes bacterium]|nr:MAG: bifunctional phosphopantothenoylcysteine decarboxylase/phosphopantothenate--cysteine ligase CoaBC [Candidatus Aminicenantes bacterium]
MKAKIALGVCSSISIYKACEIIRLFQKKKYQVQVIMTKNASRLVSPLLFSSLSGQNVLIDPFEEEHSEKIAHVNLSREISLLVVAPCTANMIGKFASGVADDFLSTFYLTVKCPVIVAPAMNEAMYLHHQTQLNMKKLQILGVKFVEPEEGYLACQEEGWGRLAAPEKIVEAALRLIQRSESLKGKTVLVTAGPTREFLDPVRFLSNRSSGKMGYEIAEEALRRGARVILISGPTHIFPPQRVEFRQVQTAQEMEKEVVKNYPKADIVIMAAAVSNFKFARMLPQKIKKQEFEEKVKLAPTQDILKKLGKKKGKKVLVGFAAETENVVDNAIRKIKEKNLDLIVANDVSAEGIGFESDLNQVSIVFPDGRVVPTEKRSKLEISQRVLDTIEGIIGKKS